MDVDTGGVDNDTSNPYSPSMTDLLTLTSLTASHLLQTLHPPPAPTSTSTTTSLIRSGPRRRTKGDGSSLECEICLRRFGCGGLAGVGTPSACNPLEVKMEDGEDGVRRVVEAWRGTFRYQIPHRQVAPREPVRREQANLQVIACEIGELRNVD
ncbi:hypothetical protein HDU67_007814 [Dinochytrium kinnereticum]|nr:hypothetical protein HDU67_007814 [Dinochytrium kinnereticum]